MWVIDKGSVVCGGNVISLECIVWVIDKGSVVCGSNVIGVYSVGNR